MELFHNTTSRSDRSEVIFLIVANLVEKKGISIAIDAFAQVSQRYDNVGLRIVGRGPLEGALRAQAKTLAIEDRVIFINNYESTDPRGCVRDEMRNADVFVLPGITAPYDYGGTPIVLMEAGAMGLPSITGNNAGNAEIIQHEQTGLVVPEDDAEALGTAMIELIEDPQRRIDFGKAARAHIDEEFNEQKQCERLEAIYNSVST